jgi:hypothetical protein
VCPGKPGLVVVISEDDLRQTVSIGPTSAAATREPAAKAGFAPRGRGPCEALMKPLSGVFSPH